MATSKAVLQLKAFTDKVKKFTKESISPQIMQMLGEYAVNLIVKRTRLGYGVNENFGQKYKLPKLSEAYVKQRKRFELLHSTTSPKKSNITYTGQLLLSMRVVQVKEGSFRIIPYGTRQKSSLSNIELAEILMKKNRTFNKLSQLEYNQLLREYRRKVGDLLKKRGLLRS